MTHRSLIPLFALTGVLALAPWLAARVLQPDGREGVSAGSQAALQEEQDESEGEDDSTAARGLVLTLQQGERQDCRVARLAALRVAEAEAPSPFLEPGPFEARFEGVLRLKLRSRLKFRAQGRGSLILQVGEETLLETSGEDLSEVETEELRISKGDNLLRIRYRSPESGDAWFRLEWAGRRYDWEPVQTEVLLQGEVGESPALLRCQQERAGRAAVADLQCLACHDGAEDRSVWAARGMPEIAAVAPLLEGAGWRWHPEWLLRWIRDPSALRADAHMPRIPGVVAGPDDEDDRVLRDLVAFLSEQRQGAPEAAFADVDEDLERRGGGRFADLGCIACHLLPTAGKEDTSGHDRHPLFEVGAKWTPLGLREFLRAPHQHAPWVRMPDFGLSLEEATELSAFLLAEARKAGTRPLEVTLGDARRGRESFAALGCAECHQAGVEPTLQAPSWEQVLAQDWTVRGCASPESKGPRYSLDETERRTLAAFASTGGASLHQRSSVEFATRQIASLQCNACHTYDGAHDRWASLVVEAQHLEIEHEGHVIDQSRPRLTWLGEKMHGSWMQGLLKGELPYSARPWLHARMPAFPARAELLAEGMAAQHGLASSRPEAEEVDDETARVGAHLLTREGFACINCHGVADEEMKERFEFQTPNLDLTAHRIRPEYYARWMFNPLRVEPSSKMPRYADDEGRSPFSEYYEGDIAQQYEAIRLYLWTIRRD